MPQNGGIFFLPSQGILAYNHMSGAKTARNKHERSPKGKEDMKMNFKGVGAIFCLIAAVLTGVRYLTAAVFMSGTSAGICFLGLGIVKDEKKAGK